jgi:23S rRNA (guanosine2251-2'-O)-methyltransferase
LREIEALAEAARIPVLRAPKHNLDAIGNVSHQGVLLETGAYPYVDIGAILSQASRTASAPYLLVLDLISDPQNLGTLLRTSEAVGVHGVIIPKRRAVGVTPAVVGASSGAVEHLRIARVTNIARALVQLREHDVWAAGLDAADHAIRYDEAQLSGGLAVVVGSEGRGLRRLIRETCDLLVRLPMEGQIGSLNASVAGSVVLYEAWRQRQQLAKRRSD